MVADGDSAVLACSALKRGYRDILRRATGPVMFVILQASKAELAERLSRRDGHFFPESLLDSQLAALEALERAEPHLIVQAFRPIEEQVALVHSSLLAAEM